MERYQQLQDLSEQDLIDRIDQLSPHTGPGVQFFYDELHRRRMNDSSIRMEVMTATIERLTRRMMALTAVAVACSIVSIIVAVSQ